MASNKNKTHNSVIDYYSSGMPPLLKDQPARNISAQQGPKSKLHENETLSPVSRESSYSNKTTNNDVTHTKQKLLNDKSGANTSTNKTKPTQACDRCRTKKIRCDSKKPQCAACASVGFECKFTDKLLRKTFPRGYTESLEERIRELEAENRKLSALSDIKQQQIDILQNQPIPQVAAPLPQPLQSQQGKNETKISNKNPLPEDDNNNNHVCDGMCIHKTLHQQPVATSFNLNDPTSISFEQDRAPGLIAAKALDTLSNHEESTQLAILVSLSVPRSTEEILFVPQLLSKIRQEYGFTSKQCLYSVTLLASLKDDLPPPFLKENSMMLTSCSKDFDTLTNKNLWQIQNLYHFIHSILKFDILPNLTSKKQEFLKDPTDLITLTFQEIDELISLFFIHWSQLIPVLNEQEFMTYYHRFKRDVSSLESVSSQPINNLLNIKYFSCLLVVLCQMGLVIKCKESSKTLPPKYSKLLSYYHHILHLLPRNTFFSVTTTSLRTLQLLCLILYYFLNTGDIVQLYGLRGTIVTMSHQLRLHRCPSAVLTGSGKKMQKLEQSNRRRLFWCTYYLDVFASFQLGVPRLFKDHEIECALPFAQGEEVDNKTDIKLEGYVTTFSLAIIRFAKVMGNILDSIFKRTATTNNVIETATIHENALDAWRNSLSKQYHIDIDVTGKTKIDNISRDKTLLVILFQLAKCMIQLPICAAVMIPACLNTEDHGNLRRRSLPSYIALQQAVNTLLIAYRQLRNKYIPLPVNTSRMMTRFALISAKEALEYKKYGELFEENKGLLLGVISDIEANRRLELPGVISWYSLEMLDLTINFFLQIPVLKGNKLDKFLQRKVDYYKSQMNSTTILDSQPIVKRKSINNDHDTKKTNKKSKVVNEYKDPSLPILAPDILNREINKLVNKENGSSQNQLLEALQEDPILNSNPSMFSNMNLSNFFGPADTPKGMIPPGNIDSTNKKDHVPPSLTESIDTINSAISPSYFTDTKLSNFNNNNDIGFFQPQLNNSSFSNMFLLLNNEGSLSQINLDTLYDNGNLFESSSEKGDNKIKNASKDNKNYKLSKNSGMVDFGSIIDASLGLAPLLVEGNNYTVSGTDQKQTMVPSVENNIPENLNTQAPKEYQQPTGRQRNQAVIADITKWQNK